MGRGVAWSPGVVEAIVVAYRSGKSTAEAAEAAGVPTASAAKILKRSGEPMRSRSEAAMILSPEAERAIAERYRNGESCIALSRALNLAPVTITAAVRRQGGEVRSLAVSHRRYTCDHHYFDVIDTEAKAYWLGFLMADGYVTRKLMRVLLQARDVGHLEKFRAALSSDHPIVTVENNGFPAASYAVASAELVAGLARHNVVQAKSLIATPPELRSDLERHFWRGAIDGDGTIGRSKTTKQWHIALEGSVPMVEGFLVFARRVSRTEARVHYRAESRSVTGQLCGNTVATSIIRALYDGATVYLDRKHALYLSATATTAERPRKFVAAHGRTLRMSEWARATGIGQSTIKFRLNRGWSPEDAVSVPAVPGGHSNRSRAA